MHIPNIVTSIDRQHPSSDSEHSRFISAASPGVDCLLQVSDAPEVRLPGNQHHGSMVYNVNTRSYRCALLMHIKDTCFGHQATCPFVPTCTSVAQSRSSSAKPCLPSVPYSIARSEWFETHLPHSDMRHDSAT